MGRKSAMVDTVILEIDLGNPKTQKVIDPTKFADWSPSLEGILSPPFNKIGKGKSLKSVNNYTPEEKRQGIYVPRLTLYKQIVSGSIKYYLYIEFSAPKILFNNNFEEVDDKDFETLCLELSNKLRDKGVNLTTSDLNAAIVRSIHYCKNIVLTDGSSPSSIISTIQKANISSRKKVSREIYQEKGESIHIYTNSNELCVYDKLRELEKAKKTEKGNLEKDSWCQFDIVGKLLKKVGAVKSFNVLRIESRLLDKPAIRRAIKPMYYSLQDDEPYGSCNPSGPYSFKFLFDSRIAKDILLKDFNEIKGGLPQIISNRESVENSILALKDNNPDISFSSILKFLGLRYVTNEKSLRDARLIFGANTKQWNMLNNEMSKLKYPDIPIRNPLYQVEQQLDKFASFKLGITPKKA